MPIAFGLLTEDQVVEILKQCIKNLPFQKVLDTLDTLDSEQQMALADHFKSPFEEED